MRRFVLFSIVFLTVGQFAFWSWLGKPVDGPGWYGGLSGVSYSPSGFRDDPAGAVEISAASVNADLTLMDPKFDRVRTYATANGLDLIAYLARNKGLDVMLGAWIDGHAERDAEEIARLVVAAQDNPNVTSVLIGNESILRGDVDAVLLSRYLNNVRDQLDVPVSSAEPWHVWLAEPQLAQSVDFLAVHILPYWEGVPVDEAVAFIDEHYRMLRRSFPGKHIVLTEVGWPSDGVLIGSAMPSPANQALFLREFVAYASREQVDYFLLEAFDQPWKVAAEGSAGAYWGIWDADANAKFSWSGPVSNLPNWLAAFVAASVLGSVLTVSALRYATSMRPWGRFALSALYHVGAGFLVWSVLAVFGRYLTGLSLLGWLMIGIGVGLLLLLLLVEAFEWLDVRSSSGLRRTMQACSATQQRPRVSVHVPLYNEPPAMVFQTLHALDAMTVAADEIIVIDNNTRDPAVWQPVEALCERLGPPFRFVHIDHCPGFKAEALNRALAMTAPDIDVIAVIDSDYLVEPSWLSDLAGHFGDPQVAIVQAPQDYRDSGESFFKRMCFWEYAGFFRIGMIQRNERNAIIQHGTMTMVRRRALEDVGGWAEWCITEDAELGLKLFDRGWKAVYTPASYGRGVMPDDFDAYRRQRFRWAYGAMQILKRHARIFAAPVGVGLGVPQRYQFLAGWLPWAADGLNLLCVVLALIWTAWMVVFSKVFDLPFIAAVVLAVVLFAFKAVKTLSLYRLRVNCSTADALGAALAGLALSYTVAKAMFMGLITSNQPFMRTPKCRDRPALVRALVSVREEAVFLLLLCAAAVATQRVHGGDGLVPLLWTLYLSVQMLPFVASIAMAIVASHASRPVPFLAVEPTVLRDQSDKV